ncbi:MAG: MarR family winged helix-turn-helix transcriptional regulator [Vulcanimicrobiota bacterium]
MKQDFGTDGKALELWNKLQKVHQEIYRDIQKNFQDKGITASQFEVLIELSKHKQLPMWKISDLLAVTGGNVTGLIDRLENKGFVVRIRSEKDRRIILAKITRKGEEIFENTIHNFTESLKSNLCTLEISEFKELDSILEKLCNNFTKEEKPV